MKTFAIAALAAVSSATLMTSADYAFMRFVTQHGKSYGTVEEFNARKEHFIRADQEYAAINANPDTKMVAGHNKFSDWTPEEYNRMMGLKDMPLPISNEGASIEVRADLPESVDWRTSGDVTPVKDQGSCGSCWAFSATGALESAMSIFKGTLPELSEQQLVDCSSAYDNNGCGGGWYFYAYDYLSSTNSPVVKLETESEYPYTARDGTCTDKGEGQVDDTGYTWVKGSTTEIVDLIKTAVAQQPCNVAVAAGNSAFQGYTGGIITTADHCPTRIDHAILAVGYGNEDGTEYLIVKNSWGSSWGEDGYVRIELTEGTRGKGVCGINQYVYYPTVV